MRLRIDGQARGMLLNDFAQQRIDGRDRIDLIAPKLDAISLILITGVDLNYVAANAKAAADRKSTRLNSSHGYISYAVFCLKKKKKLRYKKYKKRVTIHMTTFA